MTRRRAPRLFSLLTRPRKPATLGRALARMLTLIEQVRAASSFDLARADRSLPFGPARLHHAREPSNFGPDAYVCSPLTSDASGMVQDLPEDLWAYIFGILAEQRREAAATRIHTALKGYRVRIGPLRWVLRYIRKGNLITRRAAYCVTECQMRGHMSVSSFPPM